VPYEPVEDVLAPARRPIAPVAGGQTARLGDVQLHRAQRQALAIQIGRVQGNRHVQRLVETLNQDQQAGLAVQRQTPTQPGVPTRKPTWERKTGKSKKEKYTVKTYAYRELPGQKSLYVSGISSTDPTQALLNECYLVSSLSAIAGTHPRVIRNAIKPIVQKGKPTVYEVTLYQRDRQNRWRQKKVKVDAKALYARVTGKSMVKRRGRWKTKAHLYRLQISQQVTGSTGKTRMRAVAEGNVFVPTKYKVDNRGHMTGAPNRWREFTVDSTTYLLSRDGKGNAAVKAPPATGGYISLRQPGQRQQGPKWTHKYTFEKGGLMITGVSARTSTPVGGRGAWELWPIIIEKALAKLLGGYKNLDKLRTAKEASVVLAMLTGRDPEVLEKTGKDWKKRRLGTLGRGQSRHTAIRPSLQQKLIAGSRARRPMIALCVKSSSTPKLEGKHYYTVVKVEPDIFDKNKVSEVTVRDPRTESGSADVSDLTWAQFKKHFSAVILGTVPPPPKRRTRRS
jgi:hypothetical protein